MKYSFTLKFRLAEKCPERDQIADRLYEAGCDDALVGIGITGHVALAFDRESTSAFTALESAVSDVRTALPGASLIEATPDYVGLTEVAEVIGISRQGVRKLMMENEETFPSPVHAGKTGVWHLADVLDWFIDERKSVIDDATVELANQAKRINLAQQVNALPPGSLQSALELVSADV